MKKFFFIIVSFSFSVLGSSVQLNKYRVYCVTESSNVFTWREATEPAPTTCPNNTAHTINTESISICEVQDPNEFFIREEWTPTGGYFKAETYTLDIVPGPDVATVVYISWPFDISLMEINFYTYEEHENDSIIMECPFDTIVGALTQDVSINDTVLHVDGTTIANVARGMYVTLDDGSTQQSLGRIVAVDSINGTITLESAATAQQLWTTPTYVKITLRPVDFTFGKPARYRIGESVLRGSPIPANRQCRITYVNSTASAKKLIIPFEYQY